MIRTIVELATPILTFSRSAVMTGEYEVVIVFSIILTLETRQERALNTPTIGWPPHAVASN